MLCAVWCADWLSLYNDATDLAALANSVLTSLSLLVLLLWLWLSDALYRAATDLAASLKWFVNSWLRFPCDEVGVVVADGFVDGNVFDKLDRSMFS